MGSSRTGMNTIERRLVFNESSFSSALTGTFQTNDYGKRLIGIEVETFTPGIGNSSVDLIMKAKDTLGNIQAVQLLSGRTTTGVPLLSSTVTINNEGIFLLDSLVTTAGNDVLFELPIFSDWALNATPDAGTVDLLRIKAILLKEFAAY